MSFNKFKSTTVCGNFTNSDELNSSGGLVSSCTATFNGPIVQRYKNEDNTCIGKDALKNLQVDTLSRRNIAIGEGTLETATICRNNIALGYKTLNACTTGLQNIGIGINTILSNVTGVNNIALGAESLKSLPGAYSQNIALGTASMRDKLTGSDCVCLGHNSAMYDQYGSGLTFIGTSTGTDSTTSNYTNSSCLGINSKITASNQITLGTNNEYVYFPSSHVDFDGTINVSKQIVQRWKNEDNTAIGLYALENLQVDTLSRRNIAISEGTLQSATICRNNIALGYKTLNACTTGLQNIAIGLNAISSTVTGLNNISLGAETLKSLPGAYSQNIAIGTASMRDKITGSDCVSIGHNSAMYDQYGSGLLFLGTSTGTNSTTSNYTNSSCLGINSQITASNQIKLGTVNEYVHCPNDILIEDSIKLSTVQTTTTGSTSGSMISSMPFQGTSYKKVIIYLYGFNGSASYAFPVTTSFNLAATTNASLVSAISTTSVTINTLGSYVNGFVILEGY